MNSYEKNECLNAYERRTGAQAHRHTGTQQRYSVSLFWSHHMWCDVVRQICLKIKFLRFLLNAKRIRICCCLRFVSLIASIIIIERIWIKKALYFLIHSLASFMILFFCLFVCVYSCMLHTKTIWSALWCTNWFLNHNVLVCK